MLYKRIALIVPYVLFLYPFLLRAQNSSGNMYPEIGKQCPDFTLTDMHYASQKTISLKDLKGKKFILDFFSAGCTACFASMPKVNELQSAFKGKVQFILVGKPDNENKLQSIYDNYQKRFNLKLPETISGPVAQRFVPKFYPYEVWVDENGIIQAISDNGDLTREKIESFIKGKTFAFGDRSYTGREKYDSARKDINSFLVQKRTDAKDSSMLYTSFLGNWTAPMPETHTRTIDQQLSETKNVIALAGFGAWLNRMYLLAYMNVSYLTPTDSLYKEFYWMPVLEIKDSSDFYETLPDALSWHVKPKPYRYTLMVPPQKANRPYIMQLMQQDIKRYFGYEAAVEKRMVPVWKLVISDSTKLKLSKLNTQYPSHLSLGKLYTQYTKGRVLPSQTNQSSMLSNLSGATSRKDCLFMMKPVLLEI